VGKEQGLTPFFFGEQCRFLIGLGFVDVLVEMEAHAADEKEARVLRLTLKNLIMPDGGMGDTFKVLVQGKEVGEPKLLCARSLAELPLPPMSMF
jgi:SAM-dependent MidA family methyltransferase